MHSSNQGTLKDLWANKDSLNEKSFVLVECSDATYFPLITKHILPGNHSTQYGADLTIDWCFDHLCQMDLFASDSSFVILNAHQIPKNVAEWFKSNQDNILSSIKIVLLTEKKLIWAQALNAANFLVNPFKSWERTKEVDFVLEVFKTKIEPKKKAILIESDFTLFELINFIEISRLWDDEESDEFWSSQLSVAQNSYFDLAKLLSQKKFFQAFSPLLTPREDKVELISFFINHMAKIMLLPIQSNNKINNYEKEIISVSKNWDSEEVVRCLSLLQDALTLAKRKDSALESFLAKVCLKSC